MIHGRNMAIMGILVSLPYCNISFVWPLSARVSRNWVAVSKLIVKYASDFAIPATKEAGVIKKKPQCRTLHPHHRCH